MRLRAAILAVTALVSPALLAGSALAGVSAPAAKFPAWRVTWRGPGDGFKGVAAVSKNDAWAVGIKSGGTGFLLHWGGKHWRSRPLPASDLVPLMVRAKSATDVWVFGIAGSSGAAYRWDGSSWHPTPSLNAPDGAGDVAVLGPSNVWYGTPDCVSGAACPVTHWNGTSWTQVKQPAHFVLTGLSASSSANVWIVGHTQAKAGAQRGVLAAYRRTGTSWSRVGLPRIPNILLASVAAVSSANVWIVNSWTDFPRPLHWDGTRWRRLPSPAEGVDAAESIAAAGRNQIRIGPTSLWNGHSWEFGAELNGNDDDIATVPGTTSAWMVGAWFEPKTGLTGEVRFSP